MASEKSKLAKANLKTSLYFAGSITFGTVAVGAAVSIPVYLEIKKSLANAIEQFSNLSKYLSQLAQKLGLPDDSEFEQELANGYVAVYTPEGGTKVYKEVNGKKVLVMNTNSDGTVKTAASFEGVEALTMLTAIDSAKEAFDSETEAMASILDEYSDAIDDSSYLTESITTSTSVALLILRDELAAYDVDTITTTQELEVVNKTNDKLNSGIAARNNLVPDHVDQSDVSKAIQIIKDRREQIKLDEARAANALTDAQKTALEQQQKEHQDALEKAQKSLEEIKEKQAEASANAAQKVAVATQTKVIEKAESNPGANASFIFANTSTFQKWFALLGATFGNIKGNNLEEHKPSVALREPIASQLDINGLEEDKFLNLKDSLLEILGLESHKNDWKTTKEQAHKKIMTVTPILNTFANTNEDRVIVFDIKVNNIDTNKTEDYFLLARPSHKLAYDFEEYSIVGEDIGAYKNDNVKFDNFVKTLTQLTMMATSKPLSFLNDEAFKEIIKTIDELHETSPDINKIKVTNNDSIRSKLEDFIKIYGTNQNTKDIYQELAKIIFESNFTIGGANITFEPSDLNDLVKSLGLNPSTSSSSNDIYADYDKQPLVVYFLNNFTKIDNNVANIKKTFENNKASFESLGLADTLKISNPEWFFDKNIQKLIPSNDQTLIKDIKDLLSTFQGDIFNLLKQNPTGIKPYIKHMKFIKTFNLQDSEIKKFSASLLDEKLFTKYDELMKISSLANTIPSTSASYQDALKVFVKENVDGVIAKLNNPNSQLQSVVENYAWAKTLGLNDAMFTKLKSSLLDENIIAKFKELKVINSISGNIPSTSTSYQDALQVFVKENVDEFVTKLNEANSPLQTFIENYAWAKTIGLDDATFTKIKPLLLDSKYFATWKTMLDLANDQTWKPQDNNGKVGTAFEVFKKYFTEETATLINQFDSNADIVAIKESMRYTFKGVSVSNPQTQERIDAAKDVAKDLDGISGLDDALKSSIQTSVETVITSKETQALSKTEFDTIMKYTQTVFKLFPTHDDAVKQLQKVLDPKLLMANNKDVVTDIATLNKWVDEIATKNPSATITLEMIKDHAWKDGVISTKYVNGNPNVDIAGVQTDTSMDHHLLSGAQLTDDGKVMTVGSFMWELWELEHTPGSTETKISPVDPNTKIVSDNNGIWASAPYYNNGKMYAVPLVIASDPNIHEYDTTTGVGKSLPINKTDDSKETRTAIVIDVTAKDGSTKKMLYGISANQYFDEYNLSIINPTQSHVDYVKSGFTDGAKWFPTWTAGTFKLGNENYISIPVRTDGTKEFGLGMWHVEEDGHLKFVNLVKFSDVVNKELDASIHQYDPADATKVTNLNSQVWSNALVSGEITGQNASLFMLGGDGKLWNFQFKDPAANNGHFVIDETKSGKIIDASTILPQTKPDPADASKTQPLSNPWRGMTYNQSTHEINIFGITGAIYIPNQNKNINDIYNQLLT